MALASHTNSVENIWSLLKRSIIGSYHKVSVKHLDACLDELGGIPQDDRRAAVADGGLTPRPRNLVLHHCSCPHQLVNLRLAESTLQ